MRKLILIVLMLLVNVISATAAPNLTLSSASLPQNSTAILTHTITGLAVGEKVTLERLYDINGNGAIDSGDTSFRTFIVTDGARPTIGSVVNGNVPGDDDTLANGSIRIDLPLPGVDAIMNRVPGKYVIRVTGPSGTATQPFEITAVTLPQRITGLVRNTMVLSAPPVPNALVVILAGDGILVGSVRAGTDGIYTAFLPPGNYALLPFDFRGLRLAAQPAPTTLGVGQTVNLELPMATGSSILAQVSGHVREALSNNPLPSQFVICESDVGIVGGLTDLNGAYLFSVAPGDVSIHPIEEMAAQTGHISSEQTLNIANGGPITVNFTLARPQALIYGRVTDNTGAPLANVPLRAQDNNEIESGGRTTANGDYWLAVAGGREWEFGPNDIVGAEYLTERRSISIDSGEAVQSNFTLQPPTAHITGFVKDAQGVGLADVGVHATFTGASAYEADVRTGQDGSFSLPVINGTWNVSINCDDIQSQNVTCPNGQTVTVNNNNPTVNFTLQQFTVTATHSGVVLDAAGAPLGGLQLTAFKDGSTFRNATSENGNGAFYFGLNAGHWTFQIAGNPPAGFAGPSLEFNVVDGVNVNNIIFKLIAADAAVSGTVKTTNGTPVPDLRLYVTASVNNTNYYIPSVTTTAQGTFLFPAVPRGTISINPDCQQLDGLSFACPGTAQVNTTAGNAVTNIVVQALVGPRLSAPRYTPGGSPTFQFTLTGNSGAFDIQAAATFPFTNWTKIGETSIPIGQGSANVQITPQTNRFFRLQRK